MAELSVHGDAFWAGDGGDGSLAMREIDFHDGGESAGQEDDGCCRACHAKSHTPSILTRRSS